MNLIKQAAAVAIAALAAGSAHADIWHFQQNGFTGNGSITGWFQGFDTNQDGHITSNELTNFNAQVHGSGLDGVSFNYFYRWVPYLDYTIGSTTLAAGPGGYFDAYTYSGFEWKSGPTGGIVYDTWGREPSITTSDIIHVNPTAAVPEPETYAMMGLGLAALAFAARRRKAA